jgi:hypothetical protein
MKLIIRLATVAILCLAITIEKRSPDAEHEYSHSLPHGMMTVHLAHYPGML